MSETIPKTFHVTLSKAASRSTPFGTMRQGRAMTVSEGDGRYLYFRARPRDFTLVPTTVKVPRVPRKGPAKLIRNEDTKKKVDRELAAREAKLAREAEAKTAADAAPEWANPPFESTPSIDGLKKENTRSQLVTVAKALSLDVADDATKRVLSANIVLHIAAVRGEDPPKEVIDILA